MLLSSATTQAQEAPLRLIVNTLSVKDGRVLITLANVDPNAPRTVELPPKSSVARELE